MATEQFIRFVHKNTKWRASVSVEDNDGDITATASEEVFNVNTGVMWTVSKFKERYGLSVDEYSDILIYAHNGR